MSELDKLIEAVEAGEPERQVDLLHVITGKSSAVILALDSYNGSLDAALALHESLLPGWGWDVDSDSNSRAWDRSCLVIDVNTDASTPARAWLLAILRAYRSMQA